MGKKLVIPGILLVATALVGLRPTAAFADDIHVPGDFPTIQEALDAAARGDRILVAPGTYAENLDFLGKDVGVVSTEGPAVTVLAVPGGTGVVIGPDGRFQGFTVTGASETFGAAMSVTGTRTIIRNNIFDGNEQFAGGFGAAIGGNGSSPIVDANIFRNNICDEQFLSGVVAFVNSSSPRISNNIFEHNLCRAINLTLPEGTAPQVVNNTIVDNPVGIRVDARVDTEDQIYRNNILVRNEVGLHVEFGSELNNPTWEHNLVFGNESDYSGIENQTGMSGNISETPRFRAEGDYHLRLMSPAIDSGTVVNWLRKDHDGQPRPVDGDESGTAEWDIGAYEFQPLA
jgi:hypothetical protein